MAEPFVQKPLVDLEQPVEALGGHQLGYGADRGADNGETGVVQRLRGALEDLLRFIGVVQHPDGPLDLQVLEEAVPHVPGHSHHLIERAVGFLGLSHIAEAQCRQLGGVQLDMEPRDPLGMGIVTATEDPAGGSLQIGYGDVVTLLHETVPQIFRRKELEETVVPTELLFEDRLVAHVGQEGLLVDTHVEQRLYRHIIFGAVQIVCQIHQHLLGTAVLQIGDQK